MRADLGLDPGRTSGLALWVDGHLVAALAVDVPPKACGRAIAEHLSTVIRLGDVDPEVVVFAAERPFLAGGEGGRVPAMVSLLRVVHFFECLAGLYGMTVAPQVHPSTWQARYGLASGTSGARKAGAVEIVRRHRPDVLRGRRVDENIADAVLLALHNHMASGDVVAPTGFAAEWRPK